MRLLSDLLFALSALLHAGFLVLEMFLWQRPIGLRLFRQSPEKAASSAVLAANQGLYNGFLAAGMAWGLWEGQGPLGGRVRLFFGGCMVVAGLYGAWSTRSRTILIVQSLWPLLALLALGLV